MSASPTPTSAGSAVFLSYASQDAEAAKRICETLRGAGIEVWFDQSELTGGDAWDAKIRNQIKTCALFVPVISASTQARTEGYFRREWKLAVERTHDMADHIAFLVPVVIDETKDREAHVPDKFREVQWTRIGSADSLSAFGERVKRLLGGEVAHSAGQQNSLPRATDAGWKPALPSKVGRRVPAAAWLIATVAVVGAAATWSWLRYPAADLPGKQPRQVRAATPQPAAPLTDARRLTLQARALIDDDLMAVRENYRLADELCERATKLDPSDGEAWATWARVSSQLIRLRYDQSAPRVQAARGQLERARQLAPDSIEAALAQATSAVLPVGGTEKVRLLRDLLRRAPGDARVVRYLIPVLDEAQKARLLLDHQALFENDPRPLIVEASALSNRGRLRESVDMLDRAQALAPSKSGYAITLHILLTYGEDLSAAKDYVEKIPARLLLEDAFAADVARLWLRLGEGNRALQVLERVPRDFFEEQAQFGPKGFLEGWAHRVANRPLAAETKWKNALAVVNKRVATDADRTILVRWQARLQALTGQAAEAENSWKLFSELSRRPNTRGGRFRPEIDLALGRNEDAILGLQAMLLDREDDRPNVVQLDELRFDPWFEPIRKDPRVQKIIANGLVRQREMWQASASPPAPSPNSLLLIPSGRPEVDPKSVAVLPFENRSTEKENEFFADDMHDVLLSTLARIGDLKKVISRTSVLPYRDPAQRNLKQIAAELGVAHVVEGSVSRSGNRVRILVKVTDAATGVQRSAEPYIRDLNDVFQMQADISAQIAQWLAATISPELKLALAKKLTSDPIAYDLYLRGRRWREHGSAEAPMIPIRSWDEKIVALLEQAVALDSKFAAAYAELGTVHAQLYFYPAVDQTPARLAKAKAAIDTALRLDPTLPMAHQALGYYYYAGLRDYARATEEFAIALAAMPGDADVLYDLATNQRRQGRWAEAVANCERVFAINPRRRLLGSTWGQALFAQRYYVRAERVAEQFLAVIPTDREMLLLKARAQFARDGDRLRYRAFIDANIGSPDATPSGEFARAIEAGRFADAARIFEDAPPNWFGLRVVGSSDERPFYYLHATTVSGDAERGRAWARKAIAANREAVGEGREEWARVARMARLHAYAGQQEEAKRLAGRVLELMPLQRDALDGADALHKVALVHLVLGDHDRALALLDQCLSVPSLHFAQGILYYEPWWAPLHNDPRFKAALAKAAPRE